MAEEQKCQAPEGHHLCANNCGFFGSPATLNLCSKCYGDLCLKEEQASSAKIAVEKSLSQQSSSAITTTSSSSSASSSLLSSPAEAVAEAATPISLGVDGGGGGGARGGGPAGGEFVVVAAEPVHDMPEARGADGIPVPMRDDVLRGPSVPGAARVHVRFQGGGEGGHRQG
ncbi:hypothetical protein Sjap_001188 [Stephania japonica]|uniref:A20-type domain-containing protein n=1 Tax=Stephania japonica TaxID=461633 RepID=A0AAP0KL07_9MAGN